MRNKETVDSFGQSCVNQKLDPFFKAESCVLSPTEINIYLGAKLEPLPPLPRRRWETIYKRRNLYLPTEQKLSHIFLFIKSVQKELVISEINLCEVFVITCLFSGHRGHVTTNSLAHYFFIDNFNTLSLYLGLMLVNHKDFLEINELSLSSFAFRGH